MKGELIYMAQAWDKENLSPQQESNPWHRVRALSTELRELMESKVILTEFIVYCSFLEHKKFA